MGGRFAFLTAVGEFGLDGVIGLYGYPETMHRPPATPSNEVSRAAGRNEQQHSAPGPTQLAGTFTAPVLGLFGGADEGIPPSMVDAFAGALADAGVRHEIHTYPGAPHGFFELELTEHAETQADAWRRILAFVNASVTGSRSRPGP
jgi:carboxymethylenebutenolidase